jgi:hypothetical protein
MPEPPAQAQSFEISTFFTFVLAYRPFCLPKWFGAKENSTDFSSLSIDNGGPEP